MMDVERKVFILLGTSGILAQVEYGTIRLEFRIQNRTVVHSKPSIELDIRAETNK